MAEVTHEGRAVVGPRSGGRPALVVLGATLAGAAGLAAAVGYTAAALGSAALSLPVLYAAGLLGAWLVAYLLASHARVLDDDPLRWAAWGYAFAGAALLCLALAAPSLLALDVRLPRGATPNGSALLGLVGLSGVAVFMLCGLVAPAARAALLGAVAGSGTVLLGVILWAPEGAALPALASGSSTTTGYRVLAAAAGLVMLGAAAGWARRARERRTWTDAWVAVGLACFCAHLVIGAAGVQTLSAGWWTSAGLLLGGVVVPALGLLADVPRQIHELHQHEVGLRAFLDHELELAAGSGIDESAALSRVTALLDSGGFRPVFQPIYDLDSLRVVGAEALTRFRGVSPEPPDVWFRWAKEADLCVELEMAVARTALAYMSNVPSELFVSVNLSPDTIQQRLIGEILRVIPPHRLVIEVTEHEAIDSYDELNEALGDLRARGVRLAVDDAGAGFSSLRHIVRTQPDIIKLDISLVRDVDSDPVRHALTASLVAFAGQIGATIIAEGIETAGELRAVRDLGVGLGQGYYLGRPGHVDALLDIGSAVDLTRDESAVRPPRDR